MKTGSVVDVFVLTIKRGQRWLLAGAWKRASMHIFVMIIWKTVIPVFCMIARCGSGGLEADASDPWRFYIMLEHQFSRTSLKSKLISSNISPSLWKGPPCKKKAQYFSRKNCWRFRVSLWRHQPYYGGIISNKILGNFWRGQFKSSLHSCIQAFNKLSYWEKLCFLR